MVIPMRQRVYFPRETRVVISMEERVAFPMGERVIQLLRNRRLVMYSPENRVHLPLRFPPERVAIPLRKQ